MNHLARNIKNLSVLYCIFVIFLYTYSGLAQSKCINKSVLIQKIKPVDVSFKMIKVPGATYKMGISKLDSAQNIESNQFHLVKIDTLWVSEYEVTWDLFELFLAENKILFDSIPIKKSIKVDAITRPSPPFEDPSLGMGKKNYPVVNISPYAANTFCKWLSAVTGRFYRLPTEAEWEYICKGGSENIDFFANKKDSLDQYAWSYENSNYQYAEVGQKLPNAFGIYDILGNVAEWTLDQYDQKFYKREKDTIAVNPWNKPTKLHPRIYRGGSWNDDAIDLSSIKRSKSGMFLQKNDPQIPKSFWWYTDSPFIGFRLVSPYKQPTKSEAIKFWQIVLDE